MRLAEAAALFVDRHLPSRRLSSHTVRAYRTDLRIFLTFAGDAALLAECDRTRVQSYLAHLLSSGMKLSSTRRRMATIRTMFRSLEENGHLSDNPFHHVRLRIPLPRRLPRGLTRTEIQQLLRRATAEARKAGVIAFDTQTALLALELLFATGVRVAELASVKEEDIDLDEGVITIHGKGNRQRRVYLPSDGLCRLLRQYLRTSLKHRRSGATLLINSRGDDASEAVVRRLLRGLGERAGLSRRVTPHMLRHTTATLLLEEGVDIRHVQRLLGHHSIATTQIYTDVADASLKARIRERHPRASFKLR